MKVLITGGYSYLGASISENLINLKHSISIIDTLKEEQKGTIGQRHSFYNLSTDDKECEKVFESLKFDIVIYISESLQDKYNENNLDNYSGLKNVLNLSAKYNVKKFILIISAQVYGNGGSACVDESSVLKPVTPVALTDNVREYYAIKISRLNDLPVCSLRITEFYGPCSDYICNNADFTCKDYVYTSDTIRKFVDSAIKEKKILLEDGDYSRDYIYIDDVSDAVSIAVSEKRCEGIFNISSGSAAGIAEIAETVSKYSSVLVKGRGPVKIIKSNKKTKKKGQADAGSDLGPMCVSSGAMRNLTGWQPRIGLEEGIERTFQKQVFFYNKIKEKKSSAKNLSRENHVLASGKLKKRQIFAFLENILLFLIFAFLQWGDKFFNINLPDINLDYLVIYIILVAVIWGQVQAYTAMILSSVIFIVSNILLGTDIISFLYIPGNLIQLAIYLLVGIISGYAIERKNREIDTQNASYSALTSKYMFLLNIYNQNKVIKNELESQVIDAEDSFSVIYNIIQEVNSVEIESVFIGAVSAIERIMKTDKVSIYVINSNETERKTEFSNFSEQNPDIGFQEYPVYMRLKARSIALTDKLPNSIRISELPAMSFVIRNRSLYVNKKLEPSIPVMIAPVLDGKKTIAVISIHDTDFDNLTRRYENLFLTVVNLISDAIKRAYYFAESLKDKRYIEGTKVMNPETFEKILAEVRKHKEMLGMSYSLLRVHADTRGIKDIADKLSSSIRENDYIGMSAGRNLYVLLSNTSNNYANTVIDRLGAKDIAAELVSEESENE